MQFSERAEDSADSADSEPSPASMLFTRLRVLMMMSSMTGTRQVKLADSTMSKGMYPGHYYQVREGDGHTHAIAMRWAAYEVAFKREAKTFDSEKVSVTKRYGDSDCN